ncbi:MAG TPA: chloride channel protein [Bryobacteraceae bacterium]|nr:chloride channel protein [Bryobacteraceae bacterium]
MTGESYEKVEQSAPAGSPPVQTSGRFRISLAQLKFWQGAFGHLGLSEAQRFLLLALLIGIFSGLLVVLFHIAIDFISWTTLGALAGRFHLVRLLTPAIGAIGAVLIVRKVFPRAKGSGVNQTKIAIYSSDGYVPGGTIFGKFLACAVSIGSGNSLGPEDPSLQMGAGVASWLGRLFHLPRNSMRLIAPVGAAAGIAAAFNTPITGVLFVMEEVLADWSATAVGSIVLAAVSAVVTMRAFLGNQPLFEVPEFRLASASELLIYAGIGVVGGALSAAFITLIERVKKQLAEFGHWRHWVLPAAAGFLTGVVGLWFPEVMGAGYEAINSALHGQFLWPVLIYLALAKLVVTLFAFTAETPGGMFAPALFIGGMMGGGVGGLAHRIWPHAAAPAEAYLLVGMGTFFAGVFRAPITSIFMVFEVSASYVIILPVMISNITSYLISRRLQHTAFFKMLAQLEGVNLPSAEEKRSFQPLRVEDAMETRSAYTRLAGAAQLYPDEPLDAALRVLSTEQQIEVVSRLHPHEVLGTLTLHDVHRAYGLNDDHPEKPGASATDNGH